MVILKSEKTAQANTKSVKVRSRMEPSFMSLVPVPEPVRDGNAWVPPRLAIVVITLARVHAEHGAHDQTACACGRAVSVAMQGTVIACRTSANRLMMYINAASIDTSSKMVPVN